MRGSGRLPTFICLHGKTRRGGGLGGEGPSPRPPPPAPAPQIEILEIMLYHGLQSFICFRGMTDVHRSYTLKQACTASKGGRAQPPPPPLICTQCLLICFIKSGLMGFSCSWQKKARGLGGEEGQRPKRTGERAPEHQETAGRRRRPADRETGRPGDHRGPRMKKVQQKKRYKTRASY